MEVEPSSCHLLNGPDRYRELKRAYVELVQRRVTALQEASLAGGPDLLRRYQAFVDVQGDGADGDWDQLRRLYRLCVGLNVDVGHLLLLGHRPTDLSRLVWRDGPALMDAPTQRPAPVESLATPPTDLVSPDLRDLCGEIVHYHLSDHRGAHYCDVPPGEHHAAIEFEGWIRQAYALACLSGLPSWTQDDIPTVHPNVTRHMALELEASPAGFDQLVSAHARVSRWMRHCIANPDPIESVE
jgi:hypothetical protein